MYCTCGWLHIVTCTVPVAGYTLLHVLYLWVVLTADDQQADSAGAGGGGGGAEGGGGGSWWGLDTSSRNTDNPILRSLDS